MIALSLQSGSSGNSIYVETTDARLLFDSGISCTQAAQRLAAHGIDVRAVDALIISHDHGDHVRHAGVYQRRFGIPLFISPRTLDRALSRHDLGALSHVNYFMAGGEFRVNNTIIETLPSPHDCADGSVFVVSSGGKRLGILTDLGHVYGELYRIMASLDAVFLESNYDEGMLRHGPYPVSLKRRITGPRGHLSNRESAELLLSGQNLQWACLAHLSHNNNTPHRALQTHRSILGKGLALCTASRFFASTLLKIS